MAINVGTLQILVEAHDTATATLNRMSGKLKNIGSKIAGIAKIATVAGTAIGIGLAYAVGKATSVFMDFEQSVATAASVTGAVGEDFENLRVHIADVSKELGETTVFSASQAASAFYDLASSGYDVANISLKEMKPLLDLAAATQADLTTTTEIVTSTLGQFGLSIEDSNRVADVFAKTIGSSKATIDKLGISMSYVGPVANSLGYSLETTSAILGELYNKGFDASKAGTALRGSLSRLMNPTAQVKENLAQLGMTVEDVDPTMHKFTDILARLRENGMTTAQAMKIFGTIAAPAMLSITDSTDDIDKLAVALEDAGGTAETMATQNLGTLKGVVTLLKSAFEGLQITIGEKMKPILERIGAILKEKVIPAFTSFVEKIDFEAIFNKAVNIMTKLKDTFDPLKIKIGEFIAKIDFEKIKEIFNKIKSTVVETFNKIKATIEKIDFTLVTGIFTDLKAIVLEAYDALMQIFNTLKEEGKEVDIAEIINGVLSIIKKLTNFIKENPALIQLAVSIGFAAAAFIAIGAAISAVMPIISAVIAIITFLLSPIGLAIVAILLLALYWEEIWTAMQWLMEKAKDKIIEIFAKMVEAYDKFKAKIEEYKKIVVEIKDYIIDKLSGLKDEALEWGKNLIQGFIDGIKSKIGALGDTMGNAANTVKDFLGLSSPSKKGPLSSLDKWGEAFVPTYMKGIEKGATNMGSNISNITTKSVTNQYNVSAPISYSGGNGGIGMGEANSMANYIENRVITNLKRKI